MVVPGFFYFYLPRHLLARTGHYLCFLPNHFIGGDLGPSALFLLSAEDGAAWLVPQCVMHFRSTVFAKGFVLSALSCLSLKDSCRCCLLARKPLNFLHGS